MSFRRISFLLGLATLALALHPLSAQAEPLLFQADDLDAIASLQSEEDADLVAAPAQVEAESLATDALDTSESIAEFSLEEQQEQAVTSSDAVDAEVSAEPPTEYIADVEPVVTTALGLTTEAFTTSLDLSIAENHMLTQTPFADVDRVEVEIAATDSGINEAGAIAESGLPSSEEQVVAQAIAQQIEVGQATFSGPSYIGIGGNVGLASSDTTIGRAGFAVLSKIGLTPGFSARPSIIIDDDDVGILLPLTFDFAFQDFADFQVGPFLGAGLAIETAGDFIGLLLTAGVDVPFSPQFTGTVRTHISIFNEAAVGIMLGVGYNIGPALFQ